MLYVAPFLNINSWRCKFKQLLTLGKIKKKMIKNNLFCCFSYFCQGKCMNVYGVRWKNSVYWGWLFLYGNGYFSLTVGISLHNVV